jgi:membrane-bound metal-dependent hydrolase YbcI (DUF457 family)
MAFAIFGSIFPDVDIIEIREKRTPLVAVLQAVKMILYYPISAVFSIVTMKNVTKHRGFAHTLISAILFSGILYIILQYAGLNKGMAFFFFIGYCLHVLEDCFTSSGTALFLPFRTRIFGRIDTSSPLLIIVSFCFLVPIFLLLFSHISIDNLKNLEILMLAILALTLRTS